MKIWRFGLWDATLFGLWYATLWSLGRATPFGATAATYYRDVHAVEVCRCGSTKDQQRRRSAPKTNSDILPQRTRRRSMPLRQHQRPTATKERTKD